MKLVLSSSSSSPPQKSWITYTLNSHNSYLNHSLQQFLDICGHEIATFGGEDEEELVSLGVDELDACFFLGKWDQNNYKEGLNQLFVVFRVGILNTHATQEHFLRVVVLPNVNVVLNYPKVSEWVQSLFIIVSPRRDKMKNWEIIFNF
jgi:hypothetical protein